jgi:putative membrane protein
MKINIVKGFLIGIANIIPGVSGGTFALILGIYDRLIKALGEINFKIFKLILSPAEFIKEFKKMDGFFLLEIAAGAVVAIGALSWVIDHALSNYPGMTLAFFMGLIIPSIAVPYKMIDKKNMRNFFFILPGIILVIAIYNFKFVVINISLPVVFISGFLAISAMILPGISGSFLLLVFGVYESVVNNIKLFTSSFELSSFIFLVTFAAGCILGLVLFVRLMKLLFKKYPDQTLYFLIGLVLGSIVVLWPFKDYSALTSDKVEISVTTAKNIMPAGIKEVFIFAGFFVAGMLGSFGMNRIANDGDK